MTEKKGERKFKGLEPKMFRSSEPDDDEAETMDDTPTIGGPGTASTTPQEEAKETSKDTAEDKKITTPHFFPKK